VSKGRGPTARGIAETALTRVLEDGAFGAAALEAELERYPQLEARDRALATTLLYGTLRTLPWLESKLDAHAAKSVSKQRPRIRAALAIGAFQVLLLDRIPPYAAVTEAVSAVREAGDQKVAGFANAILRKVAASVAGGRPAMGDAVRGSIPAWLVRSLEGSLGAEGARAMLDFGEEAPPLGVCVLDEGARDRWLERLRAEQPEASFEPGKASPHAILVRGAGNPQALCVVRDRAGFVQEEGSQLVGLALGATPGETILDACAGRGHKTLLIARAVAANGASGAVDAADLHESKLARLREDANAFALPLRATFAVDWSVGSGEVAAEYDAVLVDAPCSGTGTLRRRPDILLRRKETDVATLAALQESILRRASKHVRPGGRLVYAVCSVLRDEAEGVVAASDLGAFGFREAPFAGAAARRIFGEACAGRLLPHIHGTDGYFLASFIRTG
jgi:16S rRNA (cytosine967-C5)-methyltransferase